MDCLYGGFRPERPELLSVMDVRRLAYADKPSTPSWEPDPRGVMGDGLREAAVLERVASSVAVVFS
jgi:hypothetical protein